MLQFFNLNLISNFHFLHVKQIVVAVILAVVSADQRDMDAELRSFTSEHNKDGTFNYGYDTSNGIALAESGAGGQISSGNSEWVSPEGERVRLTWTADSEGYRPDGSHLPGAPNWLARALDFIRDNPSPEEQKRRAGQKDYWFDL